MALRDLQAFLEDDGLEYPLPATAFADPTRFPDGKTYNVPSPDAKTGLWLTAIADLGVRASQGDVKPGESESLKLDDDEEKSLYRRVLGPVYDEMLTDGAKWTVLRHVAMDAYLSFAMSPEVADAALESPGKAQPNRATRRAAKRTAGRKSSQASTGSATPTPRPASTGSSTSPTAPEAAAAATG